MQNHDDLNVFYKEILAAAGSTRMSAWLAGLLNELRLAHLVAPSFNEHAFIASVSQHDDIIAAIVDRVAAGARQAMKRHLDAAECVLVEGMARSRRLGPDHSPETSKIHG